MIQWCVQYLTHTFLGFVTCHGQDDFINSSTHFQTESGFSPTANNSSTPLSKVGTSKWLKEYLSSEKSLSCSLVSVRHSNNNNNNNTTDSSAEVTMTPKKREGPLAAMADVKFLEVCKEHTNHGVFKVSTTVLQKVADTLRRDHGIIVLVAHLRTKWKSLNTEYGRQKAKAAESTWYCRHIMAPLKGEPGVFPKVQSRRPSQRRHRPPNGGSP